MARSPEKLRPHVKTHKMSEVVKLHFKYGITKFKCSTIAESEMVAQCGGKDVLLAMQPVDVQIDRFFKMADHYPDTQFSILVDSPDVIKILERKAIQNQRIAGLWLDINNGMNRTGILPDKKAIQLYHDLSGMSCFTMRGLHVYDGHIHDKLLIDRNARCENDFQPVNLLIQEIIHAGLKSPEIVAGGTPTFPFHAVRENTETSPGTCVLWDQGYSEQFPDLDFLHAATLLIRVVSKPNRNLLCLDLGHKAIAAEMPHPRVKLHDIHVDSFTNHSEEHMVIETKDAEKYLPGDVIYGVPWHICPTVPRYPTAYIVRAGRIEGEWKIDARDRIIND